MLSCTILTVKEMLLFLKRYRKAGNANFTKVP
jgi:hypothetical protein